MRCPIDRMPLKPVEYEGCLIHTCETCGGELVSGSALTHIVNVREETFGTEVTDLVADHAPICGETDLRADRAKLCPCCGTPMHTVNYAGDTCVLVDRCNLCGSIWLDHNELESVQLLLENWQDRAPEQLQSIASKLEQAHTDAASRISNEFSGSRFSFVNAVVNRLLDAA